MVRIAIVLAALPWAFWARPADACSPPAPGFYNAYPLDGTSLPSNAKIAFYAESIFSPEAHVAQLDAIYLAKMDHEDGVLFLDLGELGVRGPITVTAVDADDESATTLNRSYTVLDAVDTEPPTFSGVQELSVEWFEESPGACQLGGYLVTASAETATDNWTPVAYYLREVLPNDAARRVGRAFHPENAESINIYHHVGDFTGTKCYVMEAIDVGGNRTITSPRRPTCITIGEVSPDAGIPDVVIADAGSMDAGKKDATVQDAGPKQDTGTKTGGGLARRQDGGCGCSAHPSSASGSLLGLVLGLGLLLRKRRRSFI